MQAHLSSIIKFNGKKKSLYEWIRDDRDKEFGHTPIFNMMIKGGHEPNDHYYETNRVNSITSEQLNDIAAGLYIYCKNLETKTIHSKKIKYGALALAFHPSGYKKATNDGDRAIFYGQSDDISKMIILKINSLQADYLKKVIEKQNIETNDKKGEII